MKIGSILSHLKTWEVSWGHSLRMRLIVGLLLAVVALFLVLYLPIRTILLDNYLALEREDVTRTAQQLQLLIRMHLNDLQRIVCDYGWWDDTYAYMSDRDARYLDNYELETLLNNDVDLVVLFDKNGQVVFGRMLSPEGDTTLSLDPVTVEALVLASKAVWGQTVSQAVSNFAYLGNGQYLMLSATPVLSTYRQGPARGVLLMGRYMDAAFLENLSALLGYSVTIVQPPSRITEEVMVQVLSEQELTAMLVLRTSDGTPLVALSWNQPRRMYHYARQMIQLSGITLAMGGLFVGGLLLIITELIVTQRLRTLASDAEAIAQAGREGDFSLRLTVAGNDEVAHMARRLNEMLATLEATQKELLDQKFLLENLVQVARTVVEGLDLSVTLRNALEIAFSLTDARQGSLILVDESLKVQRVLILREHQVVQEPNTLVQIFMDRGLAGWVARHALPACVPDVAMDSRWVVRGDSGAPPQTGSALSVPIIGPGQVLGVLTLTHPERGHFKPSHVLMLQAAVEQIALAIRNARLYEEQRHLAQRQTVLYEMLRTISGTLERESLLQSALATLRRLIRWPYIGLWLPDESLQVLSRIAATNLDGPAVISVAEGILGRAFRERKTQYVPDILDDPDYRVMISTARSQLCVPLRRAERVLGVLDLESDEVDGFTADDIFLAESVAETLALALEGAYSYQEMRRYLNNLNVLFALARMTSQSMDLNELLSQALYTMINSMGFGCGAILLRRPETGSFTLVTDYALPEELNTAWKRGADEGWWQFLFDRNQPLMIGDLERTDLPFITRLKSAWPVALGRLSRAHLRSFAVVPITQQRQVEGILILMSPQTRIFYAEDVSLLTMLAQQLASAVSNARLFAAVTEERSRLAALIAAERDGVLFILEDGRLSLANPAALQLLQEAAESETPITQERFLAVAEQMAPELAKILRQVPDKQTGQGEISLGRRIVQWMVYPVHGDKNVLLGWLLVLRDLTETRRLEMIRDDMAHALVHDLRNPLTAMMGAVKLLSRQLANAPENTQQLLEIARSSAERMLALVTAILDLARLEEGRMPLHLQPVVLAEFLASFWSSLQLTAERKGITLSVACAPDLPRVNIDVGLVQRVIENLIGNAIKFTPEGGQVRLVARYAQDLRKVQVWVQDTGSGIPQTVLNRLFEKFASGDQVGRGSGLGLAFCRMVIEAHGEKIWLEATGPEGTTFALTLPVWEDENT